MANPTEIEAEVLHTVHAFLNAWMQPADEAVEGVLAFVAEDFSGLGTGPGDYYPDRAAFEALIVREKAEMPYPSSLEVPWIHVRLLHPTLALAEAQLRSEIYIETATHVVEPRFSLVLSQRESRWRIVHCHFSVADAMQEVGDTLRDALEGRNRELERLVEERTAELEAAHREVQIESALERVRARTMGMLRSEEFADVAVVLFQELEKLGITPRRCGFALKQGDGPTWQFWHTTHAGEAIVRAGTLAEAQVPFFREVFDAWKRQETPSSTVTFAGADLHHVIHLLIEQTDVNLPDAEAEVQQGTYPAQVCFNFFFFSKGSLLAHTLEPLDPEDRAVLERFAGVFDLAYARYEDFQRLEAKNRQVEEALAELQATQQQLIQSEKMASLGQLTAGIAHEIKNPLNFVNNFAGLSQELVDELEEAAGPEEQRALLAALKANAAKIEEHGRRADAIVRQMMEHARSGSGERRVTGLNALVAEYVTLAYHGMRARHPGFAVTLVQDFADDVGEVEIVPQEIGRVLINLLDNAFDAVRERATAEDGAYTPTVRITTQHLEEGGVEVRVADNGAGMPEAVRARVFEPFFTTKPTGSGTGLGLSMSYDIVTHGHRGSLTVESRQGEGAVFRMMLPVP